MNTNKTSSPKQSVRVKNARTKVNSEQARYMLGRSRPCSLCAWPGNRRCSECHGKAFIPTPLHRSVMGAIRQAMDIKQRYFVLQDVRQFLSRNPNFIRQHSPKPKGLPSYWSLLSNAVIELMVWHDHIGRPARKLQCANLISQIEDKLNLSPKFKPK